MKNLLKKQNYGFLVGALIGGAIFLSSGFAWAQETAEPRAIGEVQKADLGEIEQKIVEIAKTDPELATAMEKDLGAEAKTEGVEFASKDGGTIKDPTEVVKDVIQSVDQEKIAAEANTLEKQGVAPADAQKQAADQIVKQDLAATATDSFAGQPAESTVSPTVEPPTQAATATDKFATAAPEPTASPTVDQSAPAAPESTVSPTVEPPAGAAPATDKFAAAAPEPTVSPTVDQPAPAAPEPPVSPTVDQTTTTTQDTKTDQLQIISDQAAQVAAQSQTQADLDEADSDQRAQNDGQSTPDRLQDYSDGHVFADREEHFADSTDQLAAARAYAAEIHGFVHDDADTAHQPDANDTYQGGKRYEVDLKDESQNGGANL